MAESNTLPAGNAPATRIPLVMVQFALRRASSTTKAKAALRAALDMVSPDDWRLRHAIIDAVSDARSAQIAIQCYDRYAVGVSHA